MSPPRCPDPINGGDHVSGLFDLTGKTAVVSGGSRGIGLMIARGLVQAGASVVISSRKAGACEEAAAELCSYAAACQQVWAIPADLSGEAECQRLAGEVAGLTSQLDVLVNNAGAVWGAPLLEFPALGWDKVLDLDLKAPFFLTRALLPLLAKAASADDPARVINIGSIDGLVVPIVNNYSYAAAKAGLHHLTRVLAVELGPQHITAQRCRSRAVRVQDDGPDAARSGRGDRCRCAARPYRAPRRHGRGRGLPGQPGRRVRQRRHPPRGRRDLGPVGSGLLPVRTTTWT